MTFGWKAILSTALFVVVTGCGGPGPDRAETRPVGVPVLSTEELAAARENPDFARHVRPILEERCLHCHDGREMPGKLDLSTRESTFRDSRIIVPGHPSASLLIVSLTSGNHAMSMPAVGNAPPREEIAVLRRWIEQGAPWVDGMTLKARR